MIGSAHLLRPLADLKTGPGRAGGVERKQRRRENILSQAACFVYIDSSKQLLRNKLNTTPVEENSSSHRPKTPLAPENNIGLEKQATNSQKKILTWDENKTQTDGSPKTNGRDIRSARRWNETFWFRGHWHRSRRALRSVPGLLPRQFGSELHPRNISADQAQESLHDKPTVSLPRHAVRPGNYQRVDRALACKSTSGHDYKWVAARLPALYLYSAFHSLPWPHPSFNNSTASKSTVDMDVDWGVWEVPG